MAELDPPIKTLMSTFPHFVESDATVADAHALMQELDVHHLPVKDLDHKLIGMIFESQDHSQTETDADTNVRDAMLPNPYVVDIEVPLSIVLQGMLGRGTDSALVTHDGRLAGIFTLVDAANELLRRIVGSGPDAVA